MCSKVACILALLLSSASSANGFTTSFRRAAPSSRMARHATSKEDAASLLAAAAKAREEAARLEKALGKEPPVQAPPVTIKETSEAASKIEFESGDALVQFQQLEGLVSSGTFKLWNAATKGRGLRTFQVSLEDLDRGTYGKVNGDTLGITGDGEVSLDEFKFATLWVTLGCTVSGVAALAFLPENVGATFCYFFAVIPVLFLGVGSSSPAAIANVIAALKGKGETKESRIERVCRHEAGHFLCGYLCGLPVKGYTLTDSGIPSVEFHPVADGQAVGRALEANEIAILSVVAMAGSVGEILGYGNAKGGQVDLEELSRTLRRSKEFVGAQKEQNLTRWGALTAFELLGMYKEKYEALVTAFMEKKTVAECVALVEAR